MLANEPLYIVHKLSINFSLTPIKDQSGTSQARIRQVKYRTTSGNIVRLMYSNYSNIT